MADELIDVLAPLESNELARHSDIQSVRAEVQSVRSEVQWVRTEVQSVRADIAKLEGHVEGRLGELTGEIRRLEGRIDAQVAKLLYVLVPIMVSLVGLAFGVSKL